MIECLGFRAFHVGLEAAQPKKPGIRALSLAHSYEPAGLIQAYCDGREAWFIHAVLFAGRPPSWQCAAVAQLATEVYTSPLNTNGCHVEFARTKPRTERVLASRCTKSS